MNGDELKETAAPYQSVDPDSPFASLAEELFRERVLEARQMSPEEKFLAGEELFEWACSITLAGIRHQNPGIDEKESRRILEERLKMREQWEKAERNS